MEEAVKMKYLTRFFARVNRLVVPEVFLIAM